MNRTVVAATGGVITAVGIDQVSRVTGQTPTCLAAIKAGLSDARIQAACNGITTTEMLGIAAVGVMVFLAIQFWKDILTAVAGVAQPKRE